jgi:hypothetical protein
VRFEALKSLNAHKIYDRAQNEIKLHGFSPLFTYDPYTEELDVWGAILLACGAKKTLLLKGLTEPEDCGVAPYMCGRARFFCEYLEMLVDSEISLWCQSHTFGDALKLLQHASDRVAITVINPI